MGKISNLLTRYKLLEEINSPINGKLTVEKDIALGTYIRADGLTQSGSVAKIIWVHSLRKVKKTSLNPKNCLILGLGGGSIAQIITKFWPNTKIVGIDIDPIIVNLGKKYMGLDRLNVEIHIDDALNFINQKPINHYDLICVDTYQGDKFPEKFESIEFLKSIKKNLSQDGIIIFNRLYWGEKRPYAMRFLNKLEKVFKKVDVVYPEANIMFLCKKN